MEHYIQFSTFLIQTFDGRLLLIGGRDRLGNVFSNVYEFHERFGFVDTGKDLAKARYYVQALPLEQREEVEVP